MPLNDSGQWVPNSGGASKTPKMNLPQGVSQNEDGSYTLPSGKRANVTMPKAYTPHGYEQKPTDPLTDNQKRTLDTEQSDMSQMNGAQQMLNALSRSMNPVAGPPDTFNATSPVGGPPDEYTAPTPLPPSKTGYSQAEGFPQDELSPSKTGYSQAQGFPQFELPPSKTGYSQAEGFPPSQDQSLLGGSDAQLAPYDGNVNPWSWQHIKNVAGDLGRSLKAGANTVAGGLARGTGLEGMMNAALRIDPEQQARIQRVEDNQNANYLSRSVQQGLDYTGHTLGLISQYGLGWEVGGGKFLANVTANALEHAPAIAQKFLPSIAGALGMGASTSAFNEGMNMASEADLPSKPNPMLDPWDPQNLKTPLAEHAANVAKNTAYMGLYGAAGPLASGAMKSVAAGLDPVIPSAIKNLAWNVGQEFPNLSRVFTTGAKSATHAATSAAIVGTGYAGLESLNNPNYTSQDFMHRVESEIKNNVAFALIHHAGSSALDAWRAGQKFQVEDPGSSRPRSVPPRNVVDAEIVTPPGLLMDNNRTAEVMRNVGDEVLNRISEEDRNDLKGWMDDQIAQGKTLDQVKAEALDMISQHPEGQKIIKNVVQETIDAETAKTLAQVKPEVPTNTQPTQQGQPSQQPQESYFDKYGYHGPHNGAYNNLEIDAIKKGELPIDAQRLTHTINYYRDNYNRELDPKQKKLFYDGWQELEGLKPEAPTQQGQPSQPQTSQINAKASDNSAGQVTSHVTIQNGQVKVQARAKNLDHELLPRNFDAGSLTGLSHSFNVEDYLNAQKSHGNPHYGASRFMENSMNFKAMQEKHDYSPFIDRIRDSQIYAVEKALKDAGIETPKAADRKPKQPQSQEPAKGPQGQKMPDIQTSIDTMNHTTEMLNKVHQYITGQDTSHDPELLKAFLQNMADRVSGKDKKAPFEARIRDIEARTRMVSAQEGMKNDTGHLKVGDFVRYSHTQDHFGSKKTYPQESFGHIVEMQQHGTSDHNVRIKYPYIDQRGNETENSAWYPGKDMEVANWIPEEHRRGLSLSDTTRAGAFDFTSPESQKENADRLARYNELKAQYGPDAKPQAEEKPKPPINRDYLTQEEIDKLLYGRAGTAAYRKELQAASLDPETSDGRDFTYFFEKYYNAGRNGKFMPHADIHQAKAREFYDAGKRDAVADSKKQEATQPQEPENSPAKNEPTKANLVNQAEELRVPAWGTKEQIQKRIDKANRARAALEGKTADDLRELTVKELEKIMLDADMLPTEARHERNKDTHIARLLDWRDGKPETQSDSPHHPKTTFGEFHVVSDIKSGKYKTPEEFRKDMEEHHMAEFFKNGDHWDDSVLQPLWDKYFLNPGDQAETEDGRRVTVISTTPKANSAFVEDGNGTRSTERLYDLKKIEKPEQKADNGNNTQNGLERLSQEFRNANLPAIMQDPTKMSLDDLEYALDFVGEEELFRGSDRKHTLAWMRIAEKVRKYLVAQEKGVSGNAQSVRTDGESTLEGTPAHDVPGTGEKRPVDAGTSESPATSGGRPGSGESPAHGEKPAAGEGELSPEGGVLPGDARPGMGAGPRNDSASDGGRRPGPEPSTGTVSSESKRPAEVGHDFVITTELDNLGGVITRFKGNVAAIELLHQLEQQGRIANAEEQAVLAKYVGWGGIPQAFKPTDKNWSKEYQTLRKLVDDGLITQEEYESARQSTQYAHYTSKEVVEAMYTALSRMGFKGGRVLEPGMGTGNFFGIMPPAMTANSERTGVEKDRITGNIAKHLYPNANIQIKPFQDYKVRNDYYDVAVGNPPFSGKVKLTYGSGKDKKSLALHNYFFPQTLDKVRPGGIVAFVTSSGTLNALTSKNFRQMLADKANFLGAIRLPGDAFKKNAGTEVTTDIIFLQKRAEGEAPKHAGDFINTYQTTVTGPKGESLTVDNNVYYREHPDMVLGENTFDKLTYRGDGEGARMGVRTDGRDLAEALAQAVDNLPTGIYTPRAKTAETEPVFADHHSMARIEDLDENGYAMDGENIVQRQGDHLIEVKLEGKKADRLRAMIPVRDAARNVLRLLNQGAPDAELKAGQDQLSRLYDAFKKKFGYLNDSANTSAFKADHIGAGLLMSLEKEVKTDAKNAKPTYEKEAIFKERIFHPAKKVESAETAEEALVVSLFENGKLDFDHMSQLTGRDQSKLISDLAGKIYLNPVTQEWETADAYLSGNVRQKLADAEENTELDPRFKENVEALKAAQPVDLQPHQISAKLGSVWIPPQDLETFIREFLDLYKGDGTNAVKVSYNPFVHQYFLEYEKYGDVRTNVKNTDEYGVKPQTPADAVWAVDLIEDLLNQRHTVVKWSERVDGSDKRITYTDDLATSEAQNKQKMIQEIFKGWLWNDAERSERLTQKYNWEFNNTVQRLFDGTIVYGTHEQQKKLPGSTINLRDHQRNGVWRTVQGGNTLLGHVVGSGKTYTMISGGMEMKRLGLIQKPMYVVPNSMLDQWMGDFKISYPGATVLRISNDDIPSISTRRGKVSVTGKDGKPLYTTADGKPVKVMREMTDREWKDKLDTHRANRAAALSKIAVGKYDAIVITHKTFEKLPVSPELVQQHIQEQVAEIQRAIDEAMEAEGKDSKTVKELEALKEALEEKLRDNLDEERKDIAIPFEELGVDQIFVDEAHMFKNLRFHTKMRNVAGLAQSAANRSEDMYLKTQYLTRSRGGRGVVFATGTPIANAVAEMFTLMRYLMGQHLKEVGMGHFDAWAATFGQTVSEPEQNAAGQFKQKTRFSEYGNVPELMQLFRSFSDIQTREMLNLPTPENVNMETITSPMSEAQKDYMREIADRSENMKNKLPEEDNWLLLTTDARKMSLDIRLVDPSLTRVEPDGKIMAAVRKIMEIYSTPEMAKDIDGNLVERATQLVFADMGTPKKKKENPDGEAQDDGIDAADQTVYATIKAELIKAGMPESDIAFIHDANTDIRKEKLKERVRDGDVRVLIGSTEKMGAGMNVQKRLVALHHLDAPWRPADLEQREGRMVRQGNDNNSVHIFSYTTEDSFDVLSWETLKRKAKMIAQVMNGTADIRTMEEVEASTFRYAEVAAVTSKNPWRAEKFKIDRVVNELQQLKTSHELNIASLKKEIVTLPKEIVRWKQDNADIATDKTRANAIPEEDRILVADGIRYEKPVEDTEPPAQDEPIVYATTAEVPKETKKAKKEKTPAYRELAGQKMIDLANEAIKDLSYAGIRKLGEFGGFPVYYKKGRGPYLEGADQWNFEINYESATGTYARLVNTFYTIAQADEKKWNYYIYRAEDRLEQIKPLADKKFEKEDELKQAMQRQFEVTQELMKLNNAHDQAVRDEVPDEGEEDNGELSLAATPVRGTAVGGTSRARRSPQSAAQAQTAAAATPTQQAQRTIEETKNVLSPKVTERVADLITKALDTVMRQDFVKPGAQGTFNMKSEVGTVRSENSHLWRVVGHELGHAFSMRYGRSGTKQELEDMTQLYPNPAKIPKKQVQEEGFAEFFRQWVVDPELASKNAPKTTAEFEYKISANSELASLFSTVRMLVDADLAGTGLGHVAATVITSELPEENPYRDYEYEVSGIWKPIFELQDFRIPARAMMKAAKENGTKVKIDLAQLMSVSGDPKSKAKLDFTSVPSDWKGRRIQGRPLKKIIQEGIDIIGKSIKWKTASLQSVDKTNPLHDMYRNMGPLQILSAVAAAVRIKHLYERGFNKLPMTLDLAEEAIQMAQERYPQLLDLTKPKGERGLIEEYAQTLSNIRLTKAVRAGVITQDARDAIETAEEWYYPFYTDPKKAPMTGRSQGGRTSRQYVRRFKGKSAPILDLYQATLLSLTDMEAVIEHKRILDTLQDLIDPRKTPGMGMFGEIVSAPVEARKIDGGQIAERLIKMGADQSISKILENKALSFFTPSGLDKVDPRAPVVMNIRDGKPVFMRLAPDVFRMISSLHPVVAEGVGRALVTIKRAVRYTALGTPVYMTHGLTRDIWATAVQSKTPLKTLSKNFMIGALAAAGWGKEAEKIYDAYVNSGAYNSAAENFLKNQAKRVFEDSLIRTGAPGWHWLSLQGGKKLLVKVVHTPSEILRVNEEMPRISEFMSIWQAEVKKMGHDPKEMWQKYKDEGADALPADVKREMERILVESAYGAGEVTTNFSVHGVNEWTRRYAPTVPFLHGTNQGTNRTFRQYKDHPYWTSAFSIAVLSAISAILWYWMNQNERDANHLRDMPSTSRDRYLWMPNPYLEGTYIAIAKPYDFAIPMNFAERIMDYHTHDLMKIVGQERSGKGSRKVFDDLKSLFSNFVGIQVLNSVYQTFIDLQSNHNSGFGGNIVPLSQDKDAKNMQYGPTTSLTMRAVSDLLQSLTGSTKQLLHLGEPSPQDGVSPRMLDYALKNNFGKYANWALSVTDYALELVKTGSFSEAYRQQKAVAGAEYYPIVGDLLYGQAEGGSRMQTKFYDDLNKAQSLSKSTKDLMTADTLNLQKAPKDRASMLAAISDKPVWATEKNVQLLQALPALNAIGTEMSTLRKVYDSQLTDAMTPDLRRRLTFQKDYIEKMAAGLLYGLDPEPPLPDSGITDAVAQQFKASFEKKAQQAVINEQRTKGGASEQVAYLQFLMNKKSLK